MKIDHDICHEQWERFVYCRDRGHLEFLSKADKCEKFFAGLQWDARDINALKQARRPALTINKIISTISSVMGEQIYNRAEVLFRPANGGSEDVAQALSKVWMQISQNNQLQWVRSDVAADGFIRSRGFYDVRMDFNDSMMGEVRITQVNSKNVLIDPDAEEYDPDSWADVFITKWVTPQDIAILYDKEAAEYLKNHDNNSYGYDAIETVRDSFGGDSRYSAYREPEDVKSGVRRNIRILDRQHRVLDKFLHFVDVVSGDTRPVPSEWDENRIAAFLEKTNGRLNVIKKLSKRVRWTVTAGSVVLHDSWSPYKRFTVVPYFPHFRYGRTIGLVENLLGPQELLNKVASQELHIINTTANSGYKVRAGSLVNMSIEELETRGAETGLVIELDDINNIEKITPNTVPTGLDRIGYKAEEHIKTISGVSDSMMGFDREDVAAKAIAYKQQRGSLNFTKVLDNLERTDWLLARSVLDLVQQYYTEERIINITNDDPLRESESLVVNQQDPVTGVIVNDLTLGEYDIVVTSVPYRATLEDSQFEQARALREIGVPIPDSVLIENSRLMRKGEILKQMQGDQESPEAQKKKELELRNMEAEVAYKEAMVAKTQAEVQGAAQDQGANTEFVKLQHEFALKKEQADREFALQQEKLQREYELEQKKLEMEMRLKQQEMEFKLQDMQQEQALRDKERAVKEEQLRTQALREKMAFERSIANPTTTKE